MSKGYEIPISVPGQAEALRAFDNIQQKLEETGRVASQAMQRARQPATMREIRPDNPWDRLQAANTRYDLNSRLGVSENRMRALDLERIRAQRAVNRADREMNPVQDDPLKTMFMRTRLKIGPWHPLVGDLVKNGLLDESKIDGFLGRIGSSQAAKAAVTRLSAAALPVLGTAAVGAAAIRLSLQGLQQTFDSGRGYYLGGGGRNYGAAAGIFSPFGMDGRATAGVANEFGDRLRSGGFGAAWMRSQGVVDFGVYTLNKFDNLVKAIDKLRATDESTAIRVARDLGISDALWVRNLSDSSYRSIKNTGQWRNSPAAQLGSAEWEAAKTKVGDYWDQIKATATLPLADMAIAKNLRDKGRYGDMIKLFGAVAARWYVPANLAVQAWDHFHPNEGNSSKWYDQLARSARGNQGDPTKENTEAIRDLTRTMKDSPERIGIGPRGNRSVPAGWTYEMMEEAMKGQAMKLGAYTL